MAYEKQIFSNGQVLTAEHLNHIEDGIAGIELIPGPAGANGQDGAAGKDGTSVTVKSVSESTADGGSNVVTFSDGKTLTVKNGSKGSTGTAGKDGSSGTDGVGISTIKQTTTSSADGGDNVLTVTLTNGTSATFTVKNGSKGSTGSKGDKGDKGDTGATGPAGPAGADGKDGEDYVLTAADKAEIVAMVIESLGGNPIFGIVDENNNIIVNGDLADGTYSVKYEMANGSTVNIGNLVLDSNVYYTVTNNLTQCTTNNSATKAVEGGSYSATITANSGYELSDIVVKMGGTDISSTAVSGGTISIANVTGNIVITAVAEEIVVTPSYTDYAVNLLKDKRYSQSTGSGQTPVDAAGYYACEDFIPFNVGTTVRIKGLGNLTVQNTMFYTANKTLNTAGKLNATTTHNSYSYDSQNDIVTLEPKNSNNAFIRVSGVLSGTVDDVVATVDEPIV